MRVVLFADAAHRRREDAAAVINRVAGDLTGRGHEVAVVVPARFRNVPSATLQIRTEPLPFPWLAASACRALDAFDAELVHVLTSLPIASLARAFARTRALPIVSTRHADYPGSVEHCAAIDEVLTLYRAAGAPLPVDALEAAHRPSGVYAVSDAALA